MAWLLTRKSFRIKLKILMRILPFMAVNRLSILNPGTIHDVRSSIKPLITSVNMPSVSRVIGKVMNMRKGRRKQFASPRMSAASIASKAPRSLMPFKQRAPRSIAAAFISSFSKKFEKYIAGN